mgnify:CR=1 FL=1
MSLATVPLALAMRRSATHPGRAHRGQAMIETVLVLMAFLSIFLTVFDVGRMWATYQSIQNSTREATRLGTTGQRYTGLDRAGSIRYAVSAASQAPIPTDDITIESLHQGARGSGPGSSFDVLIVSTVRDVPIYSPWLQMALGSRFRARAQAAARNEDLESIDYPLLLTTSTTSTTFIATTTTTATVSTTTSQVTSTTVAPTTTAAPATTVPVSTTTTPVTTSTLPYG